MVTDTYEDYEAIDAVRWSNLKHMDTSPRHYRLALEQPREDKDHFRVGRAGHVLTLEPHVFESMFVVAPCDDRRKAAYKDFAKTVTDGRDILTPSQYERAKGFADAIRGDPFAWKYIEGATVQREQTITWTDEGSGFRCKARADIVGRYLVDLKSARDVGGYGFGKSSVDHGYVTQLAFYRDGLLANGYELEEEAILIATESSAPYDPVVYHVTPRHLAAGQRHYRQLLDRLRWCVDNDCWPGIADDQEHELPVPEWWLERYEPQQAITMGGVEVF